MNDNVLEIRNLGKIYPGVKAVNDVSFDIKRNTVHCLVGENGAGKSTLIKILTGAINRTGGKIFLNGEEYHASNPKEAKKKGIATLFQELNVVDQLTIEENLTLGMEDTTFGFLRNTDKVKKMVDALYSLEPSIDPKQRVSTLSVAQKQIIEIAKAVASDADVIIMDEPTAALSEGEIHRLFKIVKNLRANNVTVIYISHRLDEIFELGDYITVMRDGRMIDTKPINEFAGCQEDVDETTGQLSRSFIGDDGCKQLIKLMIGKTVFEEYIPKEEQSSEVILEVKNVSNHKLKDISFKLKKGEIAGFYGLVGAGKTELARAIYGVDSYDGQIVFKDKILEQSAHDSIDAGIALVPEERRTQGLFTILTIKNNIPVMNMKKISKNGFINAVKERKIAFDYKDKLKIATSGIDKEISKLSGGNQQKVVFSKCLFADADLLMLDEPTRGIDVGAKSEIYQIIRQLSNEGKSILIFSSELPEILNICDSIYLLYEGDMKAGFPNGSDVDSEMILHTVTGGE
jgi:ribose transport system ATP-binding protein